MTSIGIIDTYGFVAAVEALDTCLKTSAVELLKATKVTGGLMSIIVKGDVSAVNAAIEAGVEAAKKLGGYQRHTIIAKVDEQLHEVIALNVSETCTSGSDFKHEAPDVSEGRDLEMPTVGLSTIPGINEVSEFSEKLNSTVIAKEIDQEGTQTEFIKNQANGEYGNVIDSEIHVSKPADGEQNKESQNELIDKAAVMKDETDLSNIPEKTVSETKGSGYSEEELNTMTVSRLRKLAYRLDLKNIENKKIRTLRKSELIEYILNN